VGEIVMPLHDWTRVDPNDYHDFHLSWMTGIKSALNDGLLPAGYLALADHTTPPIVPDVITLTESGGRNPPALEVNVGRSAVTATAPKAKFTKTEAGRKRTLVGRRRIAIRHVRGRQLVAVIEIVSPSNKARKPEFADLVGKSVQLLGQGVHVLLIDPFPPTRRDPHGLHAAVWKELTGKRFTPPDSLVRTLAAYTALGDDTYSYFVETPSVGDVLPDMPLFLTPKLHVPTPLEATYLSAWKGYPEYLRKIVEGR
jgi:hypothetical protein